MISLKMIGLLYGKEIWDLECILLYLVMYLCKELIQILELVSEIIIVCIYIYECDIGQEW